MSESMLINKSEKPKSEETLDSQYRQIMNRALLTIAAYDGSDSTEENLFVILEEYEQWLRSKIGKTPEDKIIDLDEEVKRLYSGNDQSSYTVTELLTKLSATVYDKINDPQLLETLLPELSKATNREPLRKALADRIWPVGS